MVEIEMSCQRWIFRTTWVHFRFGGIRIVYSCMFVFSFIFTICFMFCLVPVLKTAVSVDFLLCLTLWFSFASSELGETDFLYHTTETTTEIQNYQCWINMENFSMKYIYIYDTLVQEKNTKTHLIPMKLLFKSKWRK